MASAIGSVVGSVISANATKKAAKTQAEAANNATAFQQHMFDTTQENLKPYMGVGTSAVNALTKAAGLDTDNPLSSDLLKPIVMDQAALEKTPGYQFNLRQGLKATQNAAAARGLGVSGAALKGASAYATGLADSTYQNQFANATTNQTNQFNRLNTLLSGGQNAAAGLGGIGQQTGANIASTISGAGNAIAASQIAGGSAIGAGIQSAANNLQGGLYGNSSSDYANNSFYNPGTYNSEAANNGLPWSDQRLKKNIRALGEENGYPVYEFEYIWSPIRYIGVMAQDILTRCPEAIKKFGKYMAVDYSKLGVQFRSVG